MLTRRPRAFSKRPRLDAVSPVPRLEATPPVTKTCLVRTGRGESADVAKLAPVVCAGGHCPSVHGVSEYQERPLLTWTDTDRTPPRTAPTQNRPLRTLPGPAPVTAHQRAGRPRSPDEIDRPRWEDWLMSPVN